MVNRQPFTNFGGQNYNYSKWKETSSTQLEKVYMYLHWKSTMTDSW